MLRPSVLIVALMLLYGVSAPSTSAQSTFTYQGELQQNAVPASGMFDMEFRLFDALSAGNQVGLAQVINGVSVDAGRFTVELDFGASALTGSDRWLEVRVNASTLVPRQRITGSPYSIHTRGIHVSEAGNVGIGTLSPTQGKVVVQSEPNGFGFVQTDGSCIVGTRANSAGGWFGTQSSHDLVLFRGGSPSAVFSSSGNTILNHTHFSDRVGIGTTAPNVPEASLQIDGGPAWTTSTWGKVISTSNGNAIEMNAGANRFGIGASNGFLFGPSLAIFSTLSGSASAVPTYLMVMSANGNVGLGTITPTFQLQLSNNSAGKPTSNTWTISSDARLKKNIKPIEHALDDLLALHGVTYQWRNPETQGNMAGTYTGMIAQDVEKVFPEWITEDPNGYNQLTTIGFEGIVVEAVRDLRDEKDAQIAELQRQVDELKALVLELRTERH